ncbi:MAG: glycosyl hydrolase [Gammaproteobacteria bacterium RIFCSPLOWO2_02_FULL_61_13]|nr:MAG: glycosyl hydrolase [Gammaproteobacteria bacterium RIFCSPLOWO2_02_FULL_61_13]
MKNTTTTTMLRWLLVLAVECGLAGAAHSAVTLTHVHGLSYSADGKRLMLPSHDGLAVYENGKWSKSPGPQHDYMGFSATAKQLYSSGHPAPGSGLTNPFGLIRSIDGGKTWDKLGLDGETDFHLLATGWNGNALYVWNPAPNSRMKNQGLHYTLNDGRAWKPARGRGLEGDPRALGVHPDESTAVAIATSKGVYASENSGERFVRIAGGEGTALFFDLDGKHLWYGSFDGQARLTRALLRGGAITQIALPPLTKDAVAYIAQNPSKREEYVIATFGRSVYLTKNGGRTWTAIAERGQGK